MTRSAVFRVFFSLYETNLPPFCKCCFWLDLSKSKQDAKHHGCVCAGPSVLCPTKGERNVFLADAGIKSEIPSAT